MDNNFENSFTPTEETQQSAAQQPVQTDAVSKAKKTAGNILDIMKGLPKKIWIAVGAGVAALLALILLVSALTNTYKTPIKLMEKAANLKNAKKAASFSPNYMNGFCEKEMEAILRIQKKTDDWDDNVEYYEERIEDKKDEYGKNYKYKYSVEDKDKLDRDDVKDFQESINEAGEEMLEDLKDLDSDDIKDLADELDISKAQARKLVKTMKKVARKMKNARISAGYEVEYTVKLTGKELDDPEEYDGSTVVYKVNGRWISVSNLKSLLYLGF